MKTAFRILPLLILVVAVYSSSFSNALLNWDDPVNVTQNHAIRAVSGANVHTWFTEPLLGMYSPLVYASFAIDYRIGRLDTTAYHATNLALHLVCVLLVLGIVSKLTQVPRAALIAAALFAVHPVNVAAVTPISVRSSLLCAACYLSAYRAYLWHISLAPGTTHEAPGTRHQAPGTRHPARLFVSFIFFLAAGLSKSLAVTFPVLMLLTDWYVGRIRDRRAWSEKVPFVVVAIVLGLVTLTVRNDAVADPLQSSWLERLALASYQIVFYLQHALLPLALSPFYPYPERAQAALPFQILVAPVIVVALAAVAWMLRRQRIVVFGLAFWLLHLLLVLKLIPLGVEFTADRYLYIPLVGLCVAGVGIVGAWRPGPRLVAAAVAVLMVGAWSFVSLWRNADWRDDMAFNNRILEHYPRAATPLANRAAAKLQAGDVQGAWRDSTDAIAADSVNARAYFNRATAGMLLGRPGEALADVTRAIEIDPALAASFELRAQARLSTGDNRGAEADASHAISLAPEGDEVFKSFVTRGLARAMLNDGKGAIADLDRAIALNPGEPGLLQDRGQIRVNFGDVAGGCADLRLAAARGRTDARALVTQYCR